MNRIRIGVLCLGVAFAVSALIAVGASAALPEFKICGKAAKSGKKYTGKYSEKACAKEASKEEQEAGKKNKYERLEWSKSNPKKRATKGQNDGVPAKNHLFNPVTEKVEGTTECRGEDLQGEVTGPKEEKWKTIFTGCKIHNGGLELPCNSKGAKAEEIITAETELNLLWLDKAHTQVGIRVKPVSGNTITTFECGGGALKIEIFGEAIGPRTGESNGASKEFQNVGEEGPKHGAKYYYEEESSSEAEAFGYFDWTLAYEMCVKAEIKEGKSKEEAESICGIKATGLYGPRPAAPISVYGQATGVKEATGPGAQIGITHIKSKEAFLIEA